MIVIYIWNMAFDLLIDGSLAYAAFQTEDNKMKKDRYLRATLLLLFAGVEAEMNRQLNLSGRDNLNPEQKLQQVIALKNIGPTDSGVLLTEMASGVPSSFRNVRNGLMHF